MYSLLRVAQQPATQTVAARDTRYIRNYRLWTYKRFSVQHICVQLTQAGSLVFFISKAEAGNDPGIKSCGLLAC